MYGAPLSSLGTDPSDEPHKAGTHGAGGFDEKQQRRVLLRQRVAIVAVSSGNVALGLACGAVKGAVGLERRVGRANLLQAQRHCRLILEGASEGDDVPFSGRRGVCVIC